MNRLYLASWFLSQPIMLWGALLLSLPLIAHFLQRKLQHFHVFPSLRFFDSAAKGYRSTEKLRRLLLLLLRSLVVIFIAMAFTRPMWFTQQSQENLGDQGATLIVIDLSPSVGRSQGGISMVADIKSALRQALSDAEKANDLCNIIIADTQPVEVLPDFSSNYDLLREQIEVFEITTRRARPEMAIQQAIEKLNAHEGPRHLMFISDFQQSNWPIPLLKNRPVGLQITRVDLAETHVVNVSISRAQIEGGEVPKGVPVVCSAQLKNYGPGPVSVEVRAFVNDQQAYLRRIELGEGAMMTPSFTHTFSEAGMASVRFELSSEDALDYDNQSVFTTQVGARPIAVVASYDSVDQPGTAPYFLSRALAPGIGGEAPFEVRFLPASQLSSSIPVNARALLLCGDARLDDQAQKGIRSYLENGGNLIVFGAHPSFKQAAIGLEDILPWMPGSFEQRDLDQPFWLGTPNLQNPVLRRFPVDLQDAFATLPLYRRWRLDGDVHPEARILLSFQDEVPALAVRMSSGGGRILVMNASPGQDAGLLGSSGIFVGLIHSLMEETAGQSIANRLQVPGQAFSFTQAILSEESLKQLKVIDPRGRNVFDAEFLVSEQNLTTRVASPSQIGLYTIYSADKILGQVAVNPDPAESDLRGVPLENREAFFNVSTDAKALADLKTGERLTPPRLHPMWPWFMVAALGFLFLENVLLAKWRS